MIPLTRLNGSPIHVNCDLIKYAEASPDTMLTLIHGEKIVVLESCEEVVHRMTAHRIETLRTLAQSLPGALAGMTAVTAANADMAAARHAQPRKQETDAAAVYRRRPQES